MDSAKRMAISGQNRELGVGTVVLTSALSKSHETMEYYKDHRSLYISVNLLHDKAPPIMFSYLFCFIRKVYVCIELFHVQIKQHCHCTRYICPLYVIWMQTNQILVDAYFFNSEISFITKSQMYNNIIKNLVFFAFALRFWIRFAIISVS